MSRKRIMGILVSDTSVLIDLQRGLILQAAFRLSHEFTVPDLLYKQELKDANGEDLLRLGLQVAELDETATARAVLYKRNNPKLSLPDVFAVSLAKASGFTLLTGDRLLRDLAIEEQVSCHGLLWLLDQMHDEEVIASADLCEGLIKIASHPRCRLPKEEVRLRMKHYNLKKGITAA